MIKKIYFCSIIVFCLHNIALAPDIPIQEQSGKMSGAKIDAGKLALAMVGVAGSVSLNLAQLIPQIIAFPDKDIPQFKQLRDGIIWASKLKAGTPEEKQIKRLAFAELYLIAVNLLADVKKMADNSFALVKTLGPLVSILDQEAGLKVNNVMDNIEYILYAVVGISNIMAQYARQDLQNAGMAEKAQKIPVPKN